MSDNPPMDETPSAPASGAWRSLVAAVLVLLLAFLLASFPARNSEVWRHLATGRALVSGSYSLGTDPFAYTTEGIVWVNHAWLWDAALFTMHQGLLTIHPDLDGRLVFLNALLTMCLAFFMLRCAQLRSQPFAAAFVVAIGLVSIGPYLILAPVVVSYLLFAFTLCWLGRLHAAAEPDWSIRANWPLLLSCALWVNCDEWFVLGPTTVALFWLVRPSRAGVPLLVASLLVCILNPHHVRAFRLPGALTVDGSASGLATLLSVSWSAVPVEVYGLTLALTLLAFWTSRSAQDRAGKFVCAALLGLSVYRSAAIPFFAITACPVIAVTWHSSTVPTFPRRFAWLAPTAAIIALIALVGAACPGWLQGASQPRGWHVQADASMKRVALQLALRYQQGEIGADARGFNFSIDLAHYIEWYCPGEKVFIDGRSGLFPDYVVADFQKVRKALTNETPGARAWDESREVFQRWEITHLEIADPTDRRLAAALRNLFLRPDEWTLVGLQSRAIVFARKAQGKMLTPTPVDLDRRAFHPVSTSIAPRQGPGRDPHLRPWWECFTWSVPDDDTGLDEAIVELVHFEALGPTYREHSRKVWEIETVAALLGAVVPHSSAVDSIGGCFPFALLATSLQARPAGAPTLMEVLTSQVVAAHKQSSDQGPPGSLLVAIRAARRDLHANPDDAIAYLRLGRAYDRLHRQTTERGVIPGFPRLEQLRKVQTLVALKRAVVLRPDLLTAHEMLASLLLEARGFDLALPHVQAQLRLTQAAGPGPTEAPEDFAARIDRLGDLERTLGKQVRELLNFVDTKSFKLDVFGKAQLAESNGLPGYALEQLLHSNYAAFGVEGAVMQLHLLLQVGRTGDFRAMIDPDQESKMGTFNYRWLQTLRAAADGDYDEADVHLRRLRVTSFDLPDLGARQVSAPNALALLFGQQVLTGTSIEPTQPVLQVLAVSPWQAPEGQVHFQRRLDAVIRSARLEAELNALRGVLDVESGAIEPARRSLHESLGIWNGTEPSATLARHYLQLIGQ